MPIEPMPTLTKRQKQFLDFIKKYIQNNGYSPTFEEIKNAFNLSALSTVHQHIEALEAKGVIQRSEHSARSIQLDNKENLLEIPLKGLIAAGSPIEAIEDNSTITIPFENSFAKGNVFALKVKGDSMIEEGIFDGDTVIIKKQNKAHDGQTVVAIIDKDEATLKKLYKEKNRFRLQPANHKLKPIYRNKIEIRGIVIKIIRDLDDNDLPVETKKGSFQSTLLPTRPKGQLLKWVGNKYKFANEITRYFPKNFNIYFEPFIGTAAVLATLQPRKAEACDTLKPLISLWKMILTHPDRVKSYYTKVWIDFDKDRTTTYTKIRDRFNNKPNALDLLFLSRSCYGGVIRFTKKGRMSTPIGVHNMIKPDTFNKRFDEWKENIKNCTFSNCDYKKLIQKAKKNDLIYCDPPYKDCQNILYGAQEFDLDELINEIKKAKKRGAKVALSIDGTKKSGKKNIDLKIEKGIFKREIFVDCGHSMLRRFQHSGKKMNGEKVKDRLLLTW